MVCFTYLWQIDNHIKGDRYKKSEALQMCFYQDKCWLLDTIARVVACWELVPPPCLVSSRPTKVEKEVLVPHRGPRLNRAPVQPASIRGQTLRPGGGGLPRSWGQESRTWGFPCRQLCRQEGCPRSCSTGSAGHAHLVPQPHKPPAGLLSDQIPHHHGDQLHQHGDQLPHHGDHQLSHHGDQLSHHDDHLHAAADPITTRVWPDQYLWLVRVRCYSWEGVVLVLIRLPDPLAGWSGSRNLTSFVQAHNLIILELAQS